MRKIVLIVLALILIIILFAIVFLIIGSNSKYRNTNSLINKSYLLFFDGNEYEIKGDKTILSEVKIIWQSDDQKKVIYEKSTFINGIGNTYGGNAIVILYNDIEIKVISFFKTNWWHTHKYIFDFSESVADSVRVSFEMIGPDNVLEPAH